MEVHVTVSPADLRRSRPAGRAVAVIDVVRAATTIACGLAAGCAGFLPVPSVAEARRRAAALGDPPPLLGGERRGVRLPGFDLGNAPTEYTPDRVAGRRVVFSTTNGTATLAAAGGAALVVVAALVNLGAAAEVLAAQKGDITLAAAGAAGRPVLDDLACAGLLAREVQRRRPDARLSDAAKAALLVGEAYQGRLLALLRESASGRALIDIGYDADLESCSQLSVLNVVPVLRGAWVTR